MFLRPQHLQTAHRHGLHLAHLNGKWDHHYNWGLRSIAIDPDALANYRLVVRSLQARLRDGTLVAVPEDGTLPALDLKPAFAADNTLTVHLAVPVLKMGRANVTGGSPDASRYVLETQDWEDENTGLNPQAVQVRLLNLKLLLSDQDTAGYETVPIAAVEKSPQAEATPRLYEPYIPPVLACDAWKALGEGILQAVYDRLGKKIELLAGQVVSRGITFDSPGQGERRLFEQLRVMNEAYALLEILAFAQGVHPLGAYLELCRLVGQLAIFGSDCKPPPLPKYDHDDLGGCFYGVKRYLDGLLDQVEEPQYKERPFRGAGLRMQVDLEPAWLEPSWQMYVGVQSRLGAEDCIKLLTKPGQLDMKIGSSDRAEDIFKRGQAGLKFDYSPRPPRALPAPGGLIYFQISRDSPEWQHVQKSLTLAIRLNETRVEGNIEGKQVLSIKTGGQTTTLQFTLYIVPPGK
jgi:type VI secretion system protein ImpJ